MPVTKTVRIGPLSTGRTGMTLEITNLTTLVVVSDTGEFEPDVTNPRYYVATFDEEVDNGGTYGAIALSESGQIVWGDVVDIDEIAGTYDIVDAPSPRQTAAANPAVWTVNPAVASGSQTPSLITAVTHNTLSVALPVMGNITTRSKLWWTAKTNLTDTDADALIQVVEGVGLVVANGGTGLSAGLASLTVTNATTGAVTLVVDETIMALLTPSRDKFDNRYWDGKFLNAAGVTSAPIAGRMSVVGAVTRAVS